MKTIAVDFETYYATKLDYGIRELGAERYARDDRFDPYLISVCDGKNSWAGKPSDFNWKALENQTVLSHNAYFDRTVYNEMVRRGWAPQVKFAAWHCTANLSSYLCNRRALDEACQFLLNVTLDKSTRDDANGKTSDQLRADAAEWDRMLAYGRSDAFHCWQLWDKFGHLWPEHERLLSNLTIEQGMRGVQIDTELLTEYLRITDTMMIVALHALPWVASGSKPTSPKAMAEACRKAGIPCPPVKSKDGVDVFDAWEAKYAPQFPWIQGVIAYRQLNKFHGTLKTIKTRLRDDGTLPFSLKYFGAHTGRWSGDAGFNLQNLRKVPIYATAAGELTEDKAAAEHALDIRRLIIPRP